MAINAEDVKIMRPERVTDESDGGGQMTGTEIVSGDVNNLLDDISRQDLATGNVSIRKLYGAVRSNNTDKYLGAHMIVAQDSGEENISTLLFDTADHYDERAAAKEKIEQFVVLATRSNLRPVGTQRTGQTSVVFFSLSEDAPEIGETLALVNEGAGLEQYIKVSHVVTTPTIYTYIDSQSNYQTFNAYQFTVKITQQLNYDFIADEPTPAGVSPTVVYRTQTSAGAKYYGIRPLAQDATAGAMSVYVDTIFQPLVPVATSETSMLDQTPGAYTRLAQAAGGDVTLNLGSHSGTVTLTLPVAFVGGSLRLSIGDSTYVDSGATLQLTGGIEQLADDASISAVDGTVILTLNSSANINATFTPAAAVEMVPYTAATYITTANRQLTYTGILKPLPDAGTFKFEYMYNGRWYSIEDTGTGKLAGVGGGSGTLNLTTGSYSVTLPAEPDEGSSTITTWAQSPYLAAGPASPQALLKITLPADPVPGTVALSWYRNSSSYAADEQSDGTLSGNASGYVEGKDIYFSTSVLPTADISVSYTAHDASVQTYSTTVAAQTGGQLTIDVGATDIKSSSIRFDLECSVDVDNEINGAITTTRVKKTLAVAGRSDGNLYTYIAGSVIVCGAVAEATGIVTVYADALVMSVNDYVITKAIFGVPVSGAIVRAEKKLRISAQQLDVSYLSDTSGSAATYEPGLSDVAVAFIGLCDDYPVPGSLWFEISGQKIVDRGTGYLYRNWSAATAAGTQCGQIGYSSGTVLLDYSLMWSVISSLSVTRLSVAGGIGGAVAVDSVVFRTAATPLRASGLQFQARRATDTALLTASSGVDGVISGEFDAGNTLGELPQPSAFNGYALPVDTSSGGSGSATGVVDNETGLVKISFSAPVILSTLTYNAVAYTTVPLSPDVLGLDPVKLPASGKVQVIQPGYLVVIHNTQSIDVAAPAAAQVIDCGRTDLAVLKITGADGAELASDQYIVDKAAGTATLADPFAAVDADGNSLTMPLRVVHRVEDMALVSDASIGGKVAITTPLTHDYPASSYVSAAIMFGDLQARVKNMFFQKVNDAGVFEDTLVGDASDASYDDLNYPLLVSNKNAVQERWKIQFTSSTGFKLIGEHLGVVATGSISADFAPINPMTGEPYFTMYAAGWNTGWVTSNIVRFNTDACAAPAWLIVTALQSSNKLADSSIKTEFRGDAD